MTRVGGPVDGVPPGAGEPTRDAEPADAGELPREPELREDAERARRWARLEQLEVLGDHWWWRPGWRAGRSFYTWHLTFAGAPEVARLAAGWQDGIAAPGLDPVPPEWLHLTLQGVGFTDEIAAGDVVAILAAAGERCARLRPFALTLGPADADPEGVPLSVRPWAPVDALRDAVRASIEQVWGGRGVPEPADGFRPHVTVAYSSGGTPAAPLRERLVRLRRVLPPVEITVREVSLIELRRGHQRYTWATRAVVPLGVAVPR